MAENDLNASDWIWTPDWKTEDTEEPRIVSFKAWLDETDLSASHIIELAASSFYKLYVNGTFIQEGSQKGTQFVWYKDKCDLSSFICEGKNEIEVRVIRYPENENARNQSLVHTQWPGLYVRDMSAGKSLSAKNGIWKCRVMREIAISKEEFIPSPLCITETRKIKADEEYLDAVNYTFFEANKTLSPFNLYERTIPYMAHSKGRFEGVVCVRLGDGELGKKWNGLLQDDAAFTVPPHTKQTVEITSGCLVCAYPVLRITGGKSSVIKMTSSECYSKENGKVLTPAGLRLLPPEKGDRTDYATQTLSGITDVYFADGSGTEEKNEVYEPFWFRTFRFYRIEIATGDEALEIKSFTYLTTNYPLEVRSSYRTSDPSLKEIYDISLRSLRLCMHETYIDCPFYEQLQYAMDSRSTILFTYYTSADDRLARQCIESFRQSQLADGILKASCPNSDVNVIPGFSIFYILMVWDHMMFFGDKSLVEKNISCIINVLNYFDCSLDEFGLVGDIGGKLFEERYWSFVDWTKEWNDTIGVPDAKFQGTHNLTFESLLYLYGLEKASELARYIGLKDLSNVWGKRIEELKKNILSHCTGQVEKGGIMLIQDGNGVQEYSLHCQIFAALTDLVTKEKACDMIKYCLDNPEITQCSISMSFYLFEALYKLNLYDHADGVWDKWRKMLRNHLTTCVENETDERSDCHAWGAVILHELPASYLGVRPVKPGFAAVSIEPASGMLSSAAGEVCTPRGNISVSWTKKSDDNLNLHYRVPSGIEIVKVNI